MKEHHRAEIRISFHSCAAAAAMLATVLFSALPVNATLLCGYVNNSNLCSKQFMEPARLVDSSLVARPDSFPLDLKGAWQCVTVVVDSLVDTVPVGQKVVSRVDFVRADDGRVVAHFQQAGWTEAQASVTAFSSTQYQMDKTNYYYGDQMNGAWAARSSDQYQLLDPNRMIAASEVDQYIAGHYAGRYRTRSTMIRLNTGMENLALERVPDPDDQSGGVKPGF